MSNKHQFDRRNFFKLTGTGAAALSLGAMAPNAAVAEIVKGKPNPSRSLPKRIIFMVADGMSWAVPSMLQDFSLMVRNKPARLWEEIQHPETTVGMTDTQSLNSLVTDSAAASTAWGSGSRVFNGSINTLPDGTAMTPLMQVAKSANKGTCLVTTTTATHATPAGFTAVVANRGSEDDIALQYLNLVDVVMAGGSRHFDPAKRKDQKDLAGEFKKAGYALLKSRQDFKELGPETKKVLGLFSSGHIPFRVDRNNQADLKDVPSLAEMTQVALGVLHENPQGFMMQIEGGRVDHGGHANDAAAAMWDMVDFDEAVAVALDYAAKNPDTLVVISSDHGTGNPGLNGMGSGYRKTDECFAQLGKVTGSYEELFGSWNKTPKVSVEQVQADLSKLYGFELSKEEATLVAKAKNGEMPEEINILHRNLGGILGQVLGNHTGFGWTGTNHTGDYTLLAAKGACQEDWHGLMKNADAFPLITSYMGVNYKNPSFTKDEAKKFLSYAPRLKESDMA